MSIYNVHQWSEKGLSFMSSKARERTVSCVINGNVQSLSSNHRLGLDDSKF